MKAVIFPAIMLLCSYVARAQKAPGFEGISIAQSDSLCKNDTRRADSLQSVFKPCRQDAYIEDYQQMLLDFEKFSASSGHFLWDKPVVMRFSRVYFKPLSFKGPCQTFTTLPYHVIIFKLNLQNQEQDPV